MAELALDKVEYDALRKWQESHDRSTRPRLWRDVIAVAAQQLSGSPPAPFALAAGLAGKQFLFSWNPSNETIIAALSSQRFAHLCWGNLGRKGLKGIGEKLILKRASALFVNDPVTAGEIKVQARRDAVQIPYVVDTEFFAFNPFAERDDYLFSCAVNDRDPQVLAALAHAGHTVVWATNAATAAGPLAKLHPRLKLVSGLSWEELRCHYRDCAAYVLPTTRDAHAAGQTTILEAIACGAPVVVSSGRTARIFDHLPSVQVAETPDPQVWLAKLNATALDPVMSKKMLETRNTIEERWSFENCLGEIKNGLANLFEK